MNSRFLPILSSCGLISYDSRSYVFKHLTLSGYFKKESICSHLATVLGRSRNCWQTPQPSEWGVLPSKRRQGAKSVNKGRALRALPLSTRACHTLQGGMTFCKVIRFQFHTEPYRSSFTSWAQTNSLFK